MTAPKLDRWKRGDPLEAKHLDQPRKAIEVLLQGVQGIVGTKGVGSTIVARFKIATISGDYLACYRIDGTGAVSTATINIARPKLLRNSMTSRGSATYSYSGTDEREATVGGDTEDQVVVPAYLADDEIYAVRAPRGGTGVSDAPLWLDMNVDARAWAKAAS